MKRYYFIPAFFALLLFAATALAQSGGVRGKVRLENGNGAAAVGVSVRSGEDEVASATTDKKGQFQVSNLKAGSYSVVFTKSGYSTGTLRRKVEISDRVIDLGDRLIIQIDPTNFAYVRGSVFDPVGRSVPGAKVELWRMFSDGKSKKVKDTMTGESGEFVFKLSAEAANYKVTVKVDRAEIQSKEILVDGAEVYRLVPFNLTPVAKN